MSQHPKLNQYTIRKEIAALIDSIKQHSDDIGNNRHVSQIERELILHKIKLLYEKSIIFNHLHMLEDDMIAHESIAREMAEATATVVSPKPEAETPKEPVTPPEPVKIVAEPVVPPVVNIPKTEIPATPEPPKAEEKNQEPVPEKKEEEKKPEPVAGKKEEDKKTEEVKPVPPASNPKPKTDIKSLIGLNERIMFVRHLFRNESASFDEALKQINACASFTEAKAFADMLKGEYAWKADDEIVVDFYDLVKRRFS